MSLIQCSCGCKYQHDGYCELNSAAQITNSVSSTGCLYYVTSASSKNSDITEPLSNYANNSSIVNKIKRSNG